MAFWLPVISIALRLVGYVRLRRFIEHWVPLQRHVALSKPNLEFARRLAELAAIAGRQPGIDATCLRQALLVYAWLRHEGFDPEFRLGGRKMDGKFDAHAWLELGGLPLDQVPSGFVCWPRHSARGSSNG